MTPEELREELRMRELLLQRRRGVEGAWTDQWRVYQETVDALAANNSPLRLFLQASAGPG